MATGWRFLLGDSATMEPIDFIVNPRARKLSIDLNRAGSSSLGMPMKDSLSTLVYPWATCILAQRDDEILWSGPVKGRQTPSWAAGVVNISAVSWFERLMTLFIQEATLTYTAQTDDQIMLALLQKARDQDSQLPITAGTVETGPVRTITYQRDQSIGQAILDLSLIENGSDFEVDPVTRAFNIHRKIGVDNPDLVWTYLEGRASNLADLGDNVDGSSARNQIRARGKYGTGFAESSESIAALKGVFQDAPSLSDVVDPTILAAYAGAEIVYRAFPRVTYTLTPKPSSNAESPRLFRDFQIGDTGRLWAEKYDHSIPNLPVRAFGADIDIADNGTETISRLQITAG